MNYREAVLNKHIDELVKALVARRTTEARHSDQDHQCPECDLLAEIRRCPERTCTTCMGSGEFGLADDNVPCPDCHGSGTPTRPGVFKPKGGA